MPSGPVVSNLGLGAHRKDVCKALGGLLDLVQPPQGPREPHPHNPFVVSIHVIIPGSGRSPGEGSGYLLQYSHLENPMERGVWWATVHRVPKSQTRLSD